MRLIEAKRIKGGISLELFSTKDRNGFIYMPGFLLTLYKTLPGEKPMCLIGRLYKGYVGVYIITRFLTLNIWILNYEKEMK